MLDYRFGPRLTADGHTLRLWAPGARTVDAVLGRVVPMARHDDGWFSADIANIGPGTLYRFRIDGDREVPDPASAFQPQDVSGPSQIVDHEGYCWRAADWKGRPWHEAILLECHVGTFTPQGSYRAMIDKLDHVVETGITAIELMPLADFSGGRNWGYDGVLWYAPDHAYGTPDDLRALIDAAHQRGLMMFLDVVYNHFGPEGNYLSSYAPNFFCKAQTPWGNAIDYRVPEVRDFVIENALHWLDRYRFDGLRLDAVHALTEPGGLDMLSDLSLAVKDFAAAQGRHIHLVLENDDNRVNLLQGGALPGRGSYRAQWNDDYHHAWHTLLTGETHGYYADYTQAPQQISRMLREGFAYQGDASPHREGASRGEPSGALPPLDFVNFLQNHDQIGNRALGERLESLAEPLAIEAALAVMLLAPMPPMLFMGEEWGTRQPFPYFCDFTGDLADAIRAGRRREFAGAFEKFGDDVSDPLDAATFRSAVLDWDEPATTGRTRLAMVRKLLRLRHTEIIPYLGDARSLGSSLNHGDRYLSARWQLEGRTLLLRANLSGEDIIETAASSTEDRVIWGTKSPGTLAPWAVIWSVDTI